MGRAIPDSELDSSELEKRYYRRFRTGYTYKEVSEMLWSYNEDPATWHKANAKGKLSEGKKPNTKKKVGTRRHSILGKWRAIKLEMWHRVLNECGGLMKYIEWVHYCKEQEQRKAA